MEHVYTRSVLLFFGLTWMLVSSEIYKSIMWTTNNPYFQNHNNTNNKLESFCFGGDLLMKVKLKSLLPVICPFEDLIMQTMDSQPSSGVLYENLWIVYDKESYDSCKVNESFTVGRPSRPLKNKKIHSCSSPDPLSNYFYRIDFTEFSPVQADLYFEGNTTYYFLATSDGTYNSLEQKSGGHCNNDGDNEIRMKFQVYVCGTNEFYNDTECVNKTLGEFICEKPKNPTPNPTVTPTTASSTNSGSISSSISSTPIVTTTSESSSLCVCPSMYSSWQPSSAITNSVVTNSANTNVLSSFNSANMASMPITPSSSWSVNGQPTSGITTCKCPTGNDSGGEPQHGQRQDSELIKNRDAWRAAAVFLICLLLLVLIIMVIICYRLKKKYSVPCIYSENKITSSQNELSTIHTNPHCSDKNALVNGGFDGVDGPKSNTESFPNGGVAKPSSKQHTVIANPQTDTPQDQPINPTSTFSHPNSPNNYTTNSHNKPGIGSGQPNTPSATTQNTGIPAPKVLPPIKGPKQTGVNGNGNMIYSGVEAQF